MKHEITLPAKIENIAKVTEWIDERLEELSCPMKVQMQIDVALDEIFGNIAHYAYRGKEGSATVQFSFDSETHTISISFFDEGLPFNPLEQTEPDTTLGVMERKIGGLGIFLVKKTMDEVSYEYKDGHNILTMKKTIFL